MKTEIFESDPFTSRKGPSLCAFDSDYRFEKSDEFFLKSGKYRIVMVRLEIADGGAMRRELHVLKL